MFASGCISDAALAPPLCIERQAVDASVAQTGMHPVLVCSALHWRQEASACPLAGSATALLAISFIPTGCHSWAHVLSLHAQARSGNEARTLSTRASEQVYTGLVDGVPASDKSAFALINTVGLPRRRAGRAPARTPEATETYPSLSSHRKLHAGRCSACRTRAAGWSLSSYASLAHVDRCELRLCSTQTKLIFMLR